MRWHWHSADQDADSDDDEDEAADNRDNTRAALEREPVLSEVHCCCEPGPTLRNLYYVAPS